MTGAISKVIFIGDCVQKDFEKIKMMGIVQKSDSKSNNKLDLKHELVQSAFLMLTLRRLDKSWTTFKTWKIKS